MVNVKGKAKGQSKNRRKAEREGVIMTDEKKNGITEVQALTACLAFELPADVREKVEHMIAVRSKKRTRKPDNSKTLANIALGEEFAENFTGETFKAADVAAYHGVSVAKASAICKAMGWEKIPSTEKVAVYTL